MSGEDKDALVKQLNGIESQSPEEHAEEANDLFVYLPLS